MANEPQYRDPYGLGSPSANLAYRRATARERGASVSERIALVGGAVGAQQELELATIVELQKAGHLGVFFVPSSEALEEARGGGSHRMKDRFAPIRARRIAEQPRHPEPELVEAVPREDYRVVYDDQVEAFPVEAIRVWQCAPFAIMGARGEGRKAHIAAFPGDVREPPEDWRACLAFADGVKLVTSDTVPLGAASVSTRRSRRVYPDPFGHDPPPVTYEDEVALDLCSDGIFRERGVQLPPSTCWRAKGGS